VSQNPAFYANSDLKGYIRKTALEKKFDPKNRISRDSFSGSSFFVNFSELSFESEVSIKFWIF
jgi:hypothetical protein